MNLKFRKVTVDDTAQFNVLMDDLSHRAIDEERLMHIIEKNSVNENIYLMVAEDENTHELVGSILAVLFDDYCDECQKLMLIENVVTSSKHRREGIGRQMFAHIEDWGRKNNVNYVILCSALNRLEAHKFYENIGYKEVKGFKKYL